MPLQTFRYAACGGANLVLNFALFTLLFHFFSKEKVVTIGWHAFEPESVALFLAAVFSFFVGFFLNKFIVFDNSNLKSRIQFFRYFVSFISNLCINWALLKMLVHYVHIHAVLAQSIVTIFIVVISYITQRHYTFKVINKTIDN